MPEDRVGAVLKSDLAKKILKQFGKGALGRASECVRLEVPRIPTHIFPLDYALGGGFPAGRVSIVYGPKSSSKTTTLLKAVASAQQLCANCWTPVGAHPTDGTCVCGDYRDAVSAFLDVEGTFDRGWANDNGVDLTRLLYSNPEFGEECLDIAEALVRSGECDVLIIDSLAFLTPLKEIEESVSNQTMGEQPRLLGKGVRKLAMALNAMRNENGWAPTILCTNQIRFKLGLLFGNPETTPGGQAPGFAASVELRTQSGKYKMDEATKKPISVAMKFKVEKNKTSGARMEGEYDLILSDTDTKKKGEVADEKFVMDMAEKIGLLERKGNQWHCLGRTETAKSRMEQILIQDMSFRTEMRKTLMDVLLTT